MAKDKPGWEKDAAEHVAKLGLGEGLRVFRSPLRKVRGSDVNLPARRWAKAAVTTIDETRWRIHFIVYLLKELGGSEAWADFSIRNGWDLLNQPEWVASAIKLEPFSMKSVQDWKLVVRQIIREQVPNFHDLPEWTTQRHSAEASGRDTIGEIQNAILDDIVSALQRLAPESVC